MVRNEEGMVAKHWLEEKNVEVADSGPVVCCVSIPSLSICLSSDSTWYTNFLH